MSSSNDSLHEKIKRENEFSRAVRSLFSRMCLEEVFPAYFILYSRHKVNKITFQGDVMYGYKPGADDLQDRLYQAALYSFGGNKEDFVKLKQFDDYVNDLDEELFETVYSAFLDKLFCYTELSAGTPMKPNFRIARTIANILKEKGCDSVFNAYSGTGVYSLACRSDKFIGYEPSGPAILAAEVLAEANGVKNAAFQRIDPLEFWPEEKYDAVIGNIAVDFDFFNVNRWDHYCKRYNQMQDKFFWNILQNGTARKAAATVVHFEWANYHAYDKTRAEICKRGLLDTVIALPETIFTNAQVCTYIVILDMAGGRSEATFIDATESKNRQTAFMHTMASNDFDIRECVKDDEKVTVKYSEMKEVKWSFNPFVYIQNATCQEGQKLVELSKIVTMPSGEQMEEGKYIPTDMLSRRIDKIIEGITPAEYTVRGDSGFSIEGPSLIMTLSPGTRHTQQDILLGICRDNGKYYSEFFTSRLQVKEDKISLEYLALAIISDPTFARFYKKIQEYYVDDIRASHLLHRKIPIFTDLAMQRKAVMESLGQSDMTDTIYNVVLAGFKDNGRYRNLLARFGCNTIAAVASIEGKNGLEKLLENQNGNGQSSSKMVDAVIYNPEIPLNSASKEKGRYWGFDGVVLLKDKYSEKGIIFMASSPVAMEQLENVGIVSPKRLETVRNGLFFMEKNGRGTEAMAAALRKKLDANKSIDAVIRTRYKDVFEAADWVDEHYASMDLHVSDIISEFLRAAEDEKTDTSRRLSDLRVVAHGIIDILRECRVVPPVLDEGAIPHLLYDGKYKNKKDGATYIQNMEIMPKTLSSSLVTLIDIGNEGTHTFRARPNLGSAMLRILMEFVQWFYSKREMFSGQLSGCWSRQGLYEKDSTESDNIQPEWDETRGIAECRIVDGKVIWICGDVHLYVDKNVDIEEGDEIVITERTEDTSKTRVEGVRWFAYPKNGKNKNGYNIIKKKGLE